MINLFNIEAYQENNRIEAKRATGGFPHSLWETYSAFANTIGGLILLGVEELPDRSFRVVGIPNSAEYLDIFWSHIMNPYEVSVNILSEQDVYIQTFESKDVMVIEVPRASRHSRPIYLGGNPFTGSYRRDGEGDYHCTPEEVRSMLRDREDAPMDLAPVPFLSIEDLSLSSISHFRSLMASLSPEHMLNTVPNREFLLATGAATTDPLRHILPPTIAGLLLFGHFSVIQQTLPFYHVEYREFMKNGFAIESGEGNWSGNLFDFYQHVNKRRTSTILPLSPDECALESSMKEAAINAILHTDYFGGEGLQILRFPDALQVKNSGLLRVPLEDIPKNSRSDFRNIGLSRIFSLIQVGSGAGRGLNRIYSTWKKQGLTPPVLKESFGPDSTCLRLPLRGFSRDTTQQLVVDYLTRSISASAKDIATHFSLPSSQIQDALFKLLKNDLVSQVSADGQTLYRLRV